MRLRLPRVRWPAPRVRADSEESPSYDGRCTICGFTGRFSLSPQRRPTDREFRCGGCRRPLLYRDEAHVLIDEYGDGCQLDLDELIDSGLIRSLRVYNVGSTGPIHKRLATLPHFVQSRFEPDSEFGADLGDGFVNQDLQCLTFADESFDLVVSSHVLEHVPDPWSAFSEVLRVLRPGGRMIHSIPTSFPLPEMTVARATLVDGDVVHHHEPRFHTSPEKLPALVFSDFGADMRARLETMGFEVSIRRPHLPVQRAFRNLVVVGRRPGVPDRGDGG